MGRVTPPTTTNTCRAVENTRLAASSLPKSSRTDSAARAPLDEEQVDHQQGQQGQQGRQPHQPELLAGRVMKSVLANGTISGRPWPSPVPTLNGVELALIYRLLHPQARRPRRSVVMQSITTKIASRLASQAMATGPRPRAGPGAGARAPPQSPTWLARGRRVPRLTATTARVPRSTANSSIDSSVRRARSGVARAGSGLGAATLGLVTGTTFPCTAAGRAALGGLGPCGARS